VENKSYIIEFTRVGNHVKVTACDTDTGVEVSTIGPASSSQKELSDLAIKKLQYVLNKKTES